MSEESKILSREEFKKRCFGIQQHDAGGGWSDVLEHDGELRAKLQRLTDLVRFQRTELHTAELISDEEYAELAQERGSVARLESYDEALARFKKEIDSLRRERDENFATRVKLSEVLAESVKNTEQAIAERDNQYEFNAGMIAKYAALEAELETAKRERDEARACLTGKHIYRLIRLSPEGDDDGAEYKCETCVSSDPEGDMAR